MKKQIKFLSIACTILFFMSCDLGDDPISDLNDKGPNLLGFVNATLNASVVTDGEDKPYILPIQLAGPTASSFVGEFSATIEADPASTAIEGVHYTLSSNTVNISSSNNLIANLPLTIITEGIVPPLDVNPILILNITGASDESVVPNGRTKSIRINIEYLCFSDITGFYSAVEGEYWRLGVLNATTASWPAATEIIFLCGNTYRVIEYFGIFNGNEWYFEVDGSGKITYPATTPDGTPQTGNGQPFVSCGTNPGEFTSVGISCGPDTDRVVVDGNNVTLYMSYGYITPGSGPRVFYHQLEKITN